MLSVSLETVRLFLHVLAATVWVGGQLTLAALVPAIRGFEGVSKAAARRFNQVAWPAFAVLVATGVWNMLSVDEDENTADFKTTLNVKMGIVVLSGVSAFLHARAKTKAGLAAWGSIAGLTALAALFLGIMLSGAEHH